MRKAAPLIIFEWIQFSGGTRSSRNHKASRRSHGKMSLLSSPGSVLIKTALMKSLAEALLYTQIVFSVKTSTDNSRCQTERCSNRRSKFSELAYTLLRWFSTTNSTPSEFPTSQNFYDGDVQVWRSYSRFPRGLGTRLTKSRVYRSGTRANSMYSAPKQER